MKSFPVFDCDAHVNDPLDIWDRYVPEDKKELVRSCYWRDDLSAFVNGDTPTFGGGTKAMPGMYNPICIAGPQMNKKIIRKLQSMVPLSDEQVDYLEHKGAYDPHARITEMDLMGIDQVLVIPTMLIQHLPYVENVEGARVFCEAYNNWLTDWCGEVPDRLYGAALLPLQDPTGAAAEVRRIAELGHPVGLIRPLDARGAYPNGDDLDVVFRTLEETGVCLGMHSFPSSAPGVTGRGAFPGAVETPGQFQMFTDCDSQALSFIFEMQTWLGQVLLSGFLDRYPKLKMLVFESNSQWLPYMLEHLDRLFKLYRSERRTVATRLPSEAFYDQCAISFESDEVQTFRQWRQFADIGIWSSDAYHHDGADSWSAMREMEASGVPLDVQEKMMGGNARRFYGIEGKLFVTDEPGPIDRPGWFPQGPELDEWAALVAHPRENEAALVARGWAVTG